MDKTTFTYRCTNCRTTNNSSTPPTDNMIHCTHCGFLTVQTLHVVSSRSVLPKGLTKAQHRQRHVLLHKHLDELLADFITHTGKLPSKTSLMEFLRWSAEQTHTPTEGK